MRLWVATAILALLTGLAGRTFHHQGDSHTAFRSGAATAKLQHLDRDSLDWSVPVARFVPRLVREATAQVLPPPEPKITAGVQSPLYVRPPPIG